MLSGPALRVCTIRFHLTRPFDYKSRIWFIFEASFSQSEAVAVMDHEDVHCPCFFVWGLQSADMRAGDALLPQVQKSRSALLACHHCAAVGCARIADVYCAPKSRRHVHCSCVVIVLNGPSFEIPRTIVPFS